MKMTDKSWNIVRNTPAVTGFVGSGGKPVALLEEEVQKILKQMRAETPKLKSGLKKDRAYGLPTDLSPILWVWLMKSARKKEKSKFYSRSSVGRHR